jgi:hypothetical protein
LEIKAIDDCEDVENEEAIYSRGRSRSRSVHEYDANVAHMLVHNTNGSPASDSFSKISPACFISDKPPEPVTSQLNRTGPLHQKEVLALKKVN